MIKIDRCLANCRRPDHGDILITATRAALQAGAILRDLYGKPLRIRHKGNIDLVTEADLAAEEAILESFTKTPMMLIFCLKNQTNRTILMLPELSGSSTRLTGPPILPIISPGSASP